MTSSIRFYARYMKNPQKKIRDETEKKCLKIIIECLRLMVMSEPSQHDEICIWTSVIKYVNCLINLAKGEFAEEYLLRF